MKIFICLVFFLYILPIMFTVSAEQLDNRWVHYSTNRANCNFYYDNESVVKLKNVVKVWTKMICPNGGAEVMSLYEIDCKERIYRGLETLSNNGFDNKPTSWSHFIPDSYDEPLFKIICKK